ncbi:MAG: MarR family transcriptional regulator [Candidatus Freyarchaeota archaeon]
MLTPTRVNVYLERRLKLPKREFELFMYIVRRGPKTEYDLKRELGMSGGTIHYVLQRLNKKGLLKAVPRGIARTGKRLKSTGWR